MTPRSPSRLLSALALFGLVACGGSTDTGNTATSGTGGEGDAASSEGSANGVVFKGPMVAGSTLTVTPLGPEGEPVGSEETYEVADSDGSYDITIAHQGLVKLVATGQAHSENSGETSKEAITLQALGEVGERTSVQVNVITDALFLRLISDIQGGVPLTDARAEAEEDFHAALGWTDRPEPESHGEIDPYLGGYESAWLLAVSTVVSQAYELYERETCEEGDEVCASEAISNFQLDVRNGFAAEGRFSPLVSEIMVEAERTANPDAAVLGMRAHMEDYGFDHPVPDIHEALDTDGDGVLNADDNCRYVGNADQELHESLPYGAACDLRASAISTGETFGCVIVAEDGRLECWDVQAKPLGGTPPHPEVFPAHAFIPWEGIPGEPFTAGGYVQFEIRNSARVGPDELGGDEETPSEGGLPDHFFACARSADGATECWSPEAAPVLLPGYLGELTVSDDRVCAAEFSLPLTDAVTVPTGTVCFDTSGGPPALSLTTALSDLAVRADDGLCGLAADGSIACFDSTGLPEPARFVGEYSAVAANASGAVDLVCGLRAGDGGLDCTGDADISAWTGGAELLAATSLSELVVGRGVVCASDAGGALLCANNQAGPPEEACPLYEEPPAVATQLTAEGCNVCGLDEDGFGHCWPRFWSQRRGEGDLHRPDMP